MRTNVLYLAYKSHLWEERLLLFRYMDEISEKRLRKDDVGGENVHASLKLCRTLKGKL